MTPLAAVVLCGGRSRRIGRDKALIPMDGRPLVAHVADRVAAVADPVLLAPGRAGRLGDLGYPQIEDAAPGAGPLGGIVAGLRASPHPLMAVVAGDMPFASPAVLRLLAGLRRREDAVVPVTARGPEPLHAVYARDALPALEDALGAGRLALRDALGRLEVRTVAEDVWRPADPEGRFATNVNRPEDVERLLGPAGGGRP